MVKDRGSEWDAGDIRERLTRVLGRDGPDWDAADRHGVETDAQREDRPGPNRAEERLREALGRGRGVEADDDRGDSDRPSIRELLDEVLNKPRERLDTEDERERELEKAKEIETARDLDRGTTHSI